MTVAEFAEAVRLAQSGALFRARVMLPFPHDDDVVPPFPPLGYVPAGWVYDGEVRL